MGPAFHDDAKRFVRQCARCYVVKPDSETLRVHLQKSKFGLKEDCDIMIDQVRGIDIKRLVKKVGDVDSNTADKVRENLKIVLDLD